MRPLDEQIDQLVSASGVKYSRYADDLYFSCSQKGLLQDIERQVVLFVESAELPSGLKVNRAKTRHRSKKSRQTVTGLVLTTVGTVSSGRMLKRRIRALIHQLPTLDERERPRLAGLLGHLASVEPAYLNNLVLKYGPEAVRQARDAEAPIESLRPESADEERKKNAEIKRILDSLVEGTQKKTRSR
jgi:RNA-directed DNA polymerase